MNNNHIKRSINGKNEGGLGFLLLKKGKETLMKYIFLLHN